MKNLIYSRTFLVTFSTKGCFSLLGFSLFFPFLIVLLFHSISFPFLLILLFFLDYSASVSWWHLFLASPYILLVYEYFFFFLYPTFGRDLISWSVTIKLDIEDKLTFFLIDERSTFFLTYERSIFFLIAETYIFSSVAERSIFFWTKKVHRHITSYCD